MKMSHKVTVYGKAECCLCDEAMEVLQQAQRRIAFDIEKIDITEDPDLFARYQFSIPVIFIDGRLAFKHRVDKERLTALLTGG